MTKVGRSADKDEAIVAFVREHPECAYPEVAERFGVGLAVVSILAWGAGIGRQKSTDHEAIAECVTANPDWSLRRVAGEMGVSSRTVARVKERMGS